MKCHRALAACGILIALLLISSTAAYAESCHQRVDLDAAYCDADGDLVADTPLDTSKWRNPDTLVWGFTPIEEPAVYAQLFRPFTRHLAACLNRQIVYYPVQSVSAEIAAMRAGRLHFAGFSTGPTVAAVNTAGAVPFATKGQNGEVRGYHLVAIVRAGSPYHMLADLKGKRVAHVSAGSNSGNLAPRALFPVNGLTPDIDYKPIMSGAHDKSVMGVVSGDYDMAAVASDVLQRLVERGAVDPKAIRVLYESPLFPTSAFAHAHDLHPDLTKKLKTCFFAFHFPPEMTAAFNGDEEFLPVRYDAAWQTVREVVAAVGALPD
ncbi:phosphonate ABC transporter substrate-binding protein [Rhizobium sp. Root73]|uniref:phosphate/phosphite/phosphonate ABC transporter substrate-binding protein n=1 Tax=unclassified Rhizobium TaxID=2613769 RepID=UPI00072C54B5|nr:MULTISPECIES: phosphate/phosphite/phosphonate ABC transporter substrate-binding protein [unclassified Rhizobium]KQY13074.1 phosphonate ABC transporter substrate-binding protein [Rhizobium sp. Root1334]KRC12534.1 phosphonate ABC transporter substrate-binding protein [Rhizobium sp. Root73]